MPFWGYGNLGTVNYGMTLFREKSILPFFTGLSSAIAGTAEDLTVSVLNFSKKSPLNKELFGRRFYTTFDQSRLIFFLFKIQCLSTAETY